MMIIRLAALVLLAMIANEAAHAQPALLDAARRGDVAGLRKMIGARTPLEPRDEAKRTPLLIAIERGHLDAARLLIEAGADINAQAENLDTPWLLAGARGHADLIRAMIPRRPNLALRNRFGGSALIPACERAHVEAVTVLLTSR